ncbi:hypothetical protein M0802_001542 [Mischocyttarus mexicanus]|nr:hypothetical protein M0802_001542 [Mischocyttarus mexicanus]
MLLASGASIPTIAGAVEEEDYARSEANSAHYDGYVTDHTDLASEIDIDESEYRRELLNDKWRMLFDKFDPEGFGEIPLEDFLVALKSAEWKTEIPANKRDILLVRAKESKVDAITFQDFVNVEEKNLWITADVAAATGIGGGGGGGGGGCAASTVSTIGAVTNLFSLVLTFFSRT